MSYEIPADFDESRAVESFLSGIKTTCDMISREAVQSAVNLLYAAWGRRSKVFIIGNGGSASTATHLACDLMKNVAPDGKPGLRALALNDNIPLVSALTNDNGFESVFKEQLGTWLDKDDVLIAISVHGGSGRDKAGAWSQNILQAITYAKRVGAKTIGITGFDGGPMKDMVDTWINTPSNSTFEVEALHVIVHHLLCECLRGMIKRAST